MNHSRYSCFSREAVTYWDESIRTSYSRFKYGSSLDALFFSSCLTALMKEQAGHVDFDNCILASSAFKHIPTAANLLANQVSESWDGGSRPERIKIHRMTISEMDYAGLGHSARFSHTSKVKLSFDGSVSLRGRELVVIDDLYFTGAHEQNLVNLLQPFVKKLTFLYLVDLHGSDDPLMESKLNRFSIDTIWDLYEIIQSGDFELNARVAKFILSYPVGADLEEFFSCMDYEWLTRFHRAITMEGYHVLPGFSRNTQLLQQCLRQVPWLTA